MRQLNLVFLATLLGSPACASSLSPQSFTVTAPQSVSMTQADPMSDALQRQIAQLPVYDTPASTRTPFDWLLTPERSKAAVYATPDGKGIVLANAMVARTFRILPNLASRWISDDVDVINPATGHRGGMHFGSSPCLASEWGYDYFRKLQTFLERTGMACLEHDGSYPGDVCASTTHAHHKGLADSQWNQFQKITAFYHHLLAEGIYINVPDYYFLNGSTKVGIGYREDNWSLPRDRQLIHTRQLNYDCTWERIPSSLWSFVPLVQYHGGGAAATLEPLSEHLYEYRTLMYQNYGAGVQACYRGPRLYDTDETRQVVQEVIGWYKRYRDILNSDIIHLRKPDARDWDGIMHVNPRLREKALAMFFNPTDTEMVRTVRLPLYYTGLQRKARVREQEGKAKTYRLTADHEVELTVRIPARGFTWYVVE